MEKIKLICFDLDHTLIKGGSWKRLGLALGISSEKDREMYDEYMSGMFTYDEWNDKVLEYYKKHKDGNKEYIIKALSNYSYQDGAREAVEYLKNKGYILVLISGSIDLLVDVVSKDLGIKYSKANNTFMFDENNKIIEIKSHGNDIYAKLKHLEDFCKLLNVDIRECACIADGDNDAEMFKATKHGVTFEDSPIKDEAWKVINSFSDLKNIF